MKKKSIQVVETFFTRHFLREVGLLVLIPVERTYHYVFLYVTNSVQFRNVVAPIGLCNTEVNPTTLLIMLFSDRFIDRILLAVNNKLIENEYSDQMNVIHAVSMEV